MPGYAIVVQACAAHVRSKQAMHGAPEAPHGRGAMSNPPNRFTPLWHVRDPDWTDPEDPAPTTQFFKDTARAILTSNASPDVGFTYELVASFANRSNLLKS